MTLVEVMIAFFILMITMVPMGYLLTSAVHASTSTRQRQAALQLADSWVETISNNLSFVPTRTDPDGTIYVVTGTQPLTSGPAGTQTPQPTLAGTTFVASADYSLAPVNAVGQPELCAEGPTSSVVVELQVTVSWGGPNNNNQHVTDSTHIPWDIPQVATEGFLSLQLNNDGEGDAQAPPNTAADRLKAIQVTLQQTSGPNGGPTTLTPNPITTNPDASGCVFAQVPTGTYSVSVAQPTIGILTGWSGSPPFVDTNSESSPPAETVVVNESAVTTVPPFAFDEGLDTAITYGSASGVDGSVECPGAAGIRCAVTGNGTVSATASWGATASGWSATGLSNITNLNQVACTSAASPTCVGVGDGPNGGAVVTTSSDLGSVTSDTNRLPQNPAITDITQVVCPSNNGCYALGQTAAGPVLLAGAVGQTAPTTDAWTIVAPPALTSFTSLPSIACPTSSTCELTGSAVVGASPPTAEILRLDGDPATLATNGAWAPTITTDSLPTSANVSTVTSLGMITCPTSTDCLATAIGDSTSPTDPTILTATIAPSGASAWSDETFPTGAGSITDLSCTSTTCVAIGTLPGPTPPGPTAAVWTGNLTASPTHEWDLVPSAGPNGIPASVLGVTSVACGQPASGDIADCEITAATSLGATGQLLEGSLSGGNWVWNYSTAPSGTTVLYYTGVACEAPASAARSTCAAAGATATGPVILTTSSGPSGTWTTQTPSSLSNTNSASLSPTTGTSTLNATVTGIPVEITPAGQSNWTTPVAAPVPPAGAATNATTLPNVLYPYAGGYDVVAGDCLAETTLSLPNPSLSALAGGTAAATLHLGMLPLQIVNASGVPVGGATVVITSTSCGSPGDQFTLPVTDADGITETSVPFGTYTYSVTVGANTTNPSTTLTIDANSLTVNSTTNYLPGPVQVPSS